MIDNGLDSKLDALHENGAEFTNFFYDKLVFSKVRESFGGRIRLMFTGSAPLNIETYYYMKAIMCCPLYEGYGLTENTTAAFTQGTRDHEYGHLGAVTVIKSSNIDEPLI